MLKKNIKRGVAAAGLAGVIALSGGAVANAETWTLHSVYDTKAGCSFRAALLTVGGQGLAQKANCVMMPTTDPANADWGLYTAPRL